MGKTTTINSSTNPLVLAISIFGILTIITALSAIMLINYHSASAESASASVNVSSACTFSSNTDSTHSTEIAPETWQENIGKTSFTVKCNDSGGYAVYAVGYSNDEYDDNRLIGPNNNIINTGVATSGNDSTWSMKLLPGEGDTASIVSPYNDYAAVPGNYDTDETNNEFQKVATYSSTTQGNTGSSFAVTYKSYIAKNQAAGDYTGKVKFTMVHPQNAIPRGKYYMQDFTAVMCEVLAHDQPITVYDKRDETPYQVQYLKDGKCWMLDNLALDLTDSTVLDALTPANTNADDKALTSLRNGNRAAGDQYATAGVTNWTSGKSYSQPMVNMDSKNTTVTSYGNNNGKVGGYYNYCAASAGGYCYGNGTSAGTSSGDATTSICPAGWRMPTGGDYDYSTQTGAGEYFALGTALGLTISKGFWGFEGTTYQTALGTPLSGWFYNGWAGAQGDSGIWWSSTLYDDSSMFLPTAVSDGVYPTDLYDRDYGSSMRCVAGS